VHGARSAVLLGSLAISVMGLAGPVSAETITFTERETITETFSDEPFVCQNELYTVTATVRAMTHVTVRLDANGDLAFLRLTDQARGRVVAVPLDGTGPTYVARFQSYDLETIRNVRHGTLVETDTDHNRVIAKGSDGSHVILHELHHFTINASGDVSIQFDKVRLDC
jgi:hypothetical protein